MVGRTAVITGGDGVLGQALAAAFLQAGYRVHSPGKSQLDVRQEQSVIDYFSALETVGVLVNNAGCTRDALSSRLSAADWQEVLDVNLRGSWLCAVSARERAERTGQLGQLHIINISSHSASVGKAGQANYAAAKAGVLGLTTRLAEEWGPDGVRVNAIAPGFLETPMTSRLPAKTITAALESHCLGRLTTVPDVARFMVFLDTLENVSGQLFQLDSRISSRF